MRPFVGNELATLVRSSSTVTVAHVVIVVASSSGATVADEVVVVASSSTVTVLHEVIVVRSGPIRTVALVVCTGGSLIVSVTVVAAKAAVASASSIRCLQIRSATACAIESQQDSRKPSQTQR